MTRRDALKLAFLPPLIRSAGAQEPTRVLLFGGQSNAQGMGIPVQLTPVPGWAQNTANGWEGHPAQSETGYQYPASSIGNFPCLYWGDNYANIQDKWGRYLGEFAGSDGALQPPGNYGPEYAFCWRYRLAYPTRPLCIIKHAVGGTGITDWIPYDGTLNPLGPGSCWTDFVTVINQAKARLAAASVTYQWEALVWYQGENGAVISFAADKFDIQTRWFLSLLRGMTSADLKCCIGRISDNWQSPLIVAEAMGGYPQFDAAGIRANVENRRNEQIAVGGDPGNCWWSNDGIPPNDVNTAVGWYHFTPSGYLTVGERAWNAYSALLGGAGSPSGGVGGSFRGRVTGQGTIR